MMTENYNDREQGTGEQPDINDLPGASDASETDDSSNIPGTSSHEGLDGSAAGEEEPNDPSGSFTPHEAKGSKLQFIIWGVLVLIAIVGIILIFIAYGTDDDNDVADEQVLAYVNEEPITNRDIATLVDQMSMQYQSQGMEVPEEMMEDLRKEALISMIRQRIMVQHAEDLEMEIEQQDIDEQFDESVAQFGGDEEEMLAQVEQMMGLDKEDIEDDIQTTLLLQKLARAQETTEVTEEEARERYQEFIEQSTAMGQDESEIPPFEEVQDMIIEQLENEKMMQALEQVFEDLLDDTEIEIVDEQLEDVEAIMRGEKELTPEQPQEAPAPAPQDGAEPAPMP